MSRRRFYWMLGFLVVALAIAVSATVRQIQQDLLLHGQAAIAAAEIPYYGLHIEGRDAVLTGSVTEGTDIARLAAVVAQVPGVRTVRSEVTVTPASRPAGPGAPGRLAIRPPELRAQHLGGIVVVTGRLPADGSVDALEEALRSQFPCATLRVDVRRDEAVAAREWTANLDLLMAALAELDGPARVAAYGDVVQLSGQISGPARRATLENILATTPALEWRLTLTQPSGSIGGAP